MPQPSDTVILVITNLTNTSNSLTVSQFSGNNLVVNKTISENITVGGNSNTTNLTVNKTAENVLVTDYNNGNNLVINQPSSTVVITATPVSASAPGPQGLRGATGAISLTFDDVPPVSPAIGDMWMDSSTGVMFVYFSDGDSSQWMELGGGLGFTGPRGVTGADSFVPGPTGPTGAKGETGETGPQGIQGITGEIGPTGNISSVGVDTQFAYNSNGVLTGSTAFTYNAGLFSFTGDVEIFGRLLVNGIVVTTIGFQGFTGDADQEFVEGVMMDGGEYS